MTFIENGIHKVVPPNGKSHYYESTKGLQVNDFTVPILTAIVHSVATYALTTKRDIRISLEIDELHTLTSFVKVETATDWLNKIRERGGGVIGV